MIRAMDALFDAVEPRAITAAKVADIASWSFLAFCSVGLCLAVGAFLLHGHHIVGL